MVELFQKGFFELDKILSKQSTELFKEINGVSQKILNTIVREGPMTIYQIGKETKIPRPTIYRHLKGETGLLEQGLLRCIKIEKFEPIEGLVKKYFGLTLKGVFASLRDVRLEDVYLIKSYFKILSERYQSLAEVFKVEINFGEGKKPASIVDVVALYIKTEIALWFQCHLENGLQLTFVKDMPEYYYSTRNVSKIFNLLKGQIRFDEERKVWILSAGSDIQKMLMCIKTSPIEALLEIYDEKLEVLREVSYWPLILGLLNDEWNVKHIDRIFEGIPSTELEYYPEVPGDIIIEKFPAITIRSGPRYVELKRKKKVGGR